MFTLFQANRTRTGRALAALALAAVLSASMAASPATGEARSLAEVVQTKQEKIQKKVRKNRKKVRRNKKRARRGAKSARNNETRIEQHQKWIHALGQAVQNLRDAATAGPRGPVGPQGSQGPQGPKGDRGPAGPSGSVNGTAAGGDLEGTYPDPTIKNGAIAAPQLVDGAVATVKLAMGAVTTQTLADDAVTSAKVKDDSLTGDDVDESSLQPVPQAEAVNGVSVVPISATMGEGDPTETIFNAGGLALELDCWDDSSGQSVTRLVAENTGSGYSILAWPGNRTGLFPGNRYPLSHVATSLISFSYSTAAGGSVTGQIQPLDNVPGRPDCEVHGVVHTVSP